MWALKYSNAKKKLKNPTDLFILNSMLLFVRALCVVFWNALVGFEYLRVIFWLEYTCGFGESENWRMCQPELEPGQSELFLFNARALHASKLHKQVFFCFFWWTWCSIIISSSIKRLQNITRIFCCFIGRQCNTQAWFIILAGFAFVTLHASIMFYSFDIVHLITFTFIRTFAYLVIFFHSFGFYSFMHFSCVRKIFCDFVITFLL